MFCSNCGSKIEENTKFCANCGTPVQNVPVMPMEQPVPINQPVPMEQPAPMEQPVSMEQPAPMEQPVPMEQPAPMEQPVPMEQPAPMEQPMPMEQPEVNPFATSVENAAPAVDAFGNPVTNAAPAVDAFGNPVMNTAPAVDAFGNPVAPQGTEQWNPLMQPKKSKKPLIIGIIAGVILLAAIVAVILIFFVFGDDKDDDKKKDNIETTTIVAETTTEEETTQEETTEEETTTAVENQLLSESDASDKVFDLFVALKDRDYDKLEDLYYSENYENGVKFYAEKYEDSKDEDDAYDVTKNVTGFDEKIFGHINMVVSGFDVHVTILDSADTQSIYSKYQGVENVAVVNSDIRLGSEDRNGRFDVNMILVEINSEWKVFSVNTDMYSYENYSSEYEFTGRGDDEFAEKYGTRDGEKETTTSDDDEGNIDPIVNENGNKDVKKLVEESLKAVIEYDFESLEGNLHPTFVSMIYLMVEDSDKKDEMADVMFADMGIKKGNKYVKSSNKEVKLTDEEKEDIEEGCKMLSIDYEDMKFFESTVTYKDANNKTKTMEFKTVAIKSNGLWVALDVAAE